MAHLNSGFCPEGETAQSVERAIADIARTLRAAETAMRLGEISVADFLLLSARHGLGLIHERYQGPKLSAERGLIEALSRRLAGLRPDDAADLSAAAGEFQLTLAQLATLERLLRRQEHKSLYNKKHLRRLIDRAR